MNDISEPMMRKIIDLTTENVLLKIPEVIGNLITHHVAMNKNNKDFYNAHPEFRKHKEIVASVLEQIEGKNPPMDYHKLLDKAIPQISDRIKETQKLDFENLKIPSMDFNGEF